MKIATYANVRTTLEARKGVRKAFITAFRSGAVMGFLLAANGLLVLYIANNLFKIYYGDDWEGLFGAITSYGLDGSSMALFGRIFDNDHCRQPAAVKVVILECQCEDVIGVKVLKSELRRRSSAVDSDMEYNWNANIEICLRRKRRKSLRAVLKPAQYTGVQAIAERHIPDFEGN
ncbi:hypothetical protein VitviT2T_016193 [Vitis vinifera]|uniref:H(+)-exporting diphosphatase n=1 Tax=Vitis vinifera TaxID=29760 RepID=A0ABY9CQ58_VITVI|nr:hypothetical protein VitviT2T_016193 [Vitis vinifera]